MWHLYNYYDDRQVLENHYDGVKRQVEYFSRHAKAFILDDALGDHMEPGTGVSSNPSPFETPKDVCATAYFYRCSQILSQMADITGQEDDAVTYLALAESIKRAFIEAFLDSETGKVATGSQTSNGLALYFDLVPEESRTKVLDHLVEEIVERRGGHLKTGIIGTDALVQALPELGRSDLMYEIASKTTFPSWGYGVVHGQTTIAEDFGCSHYYSVSMKMFGSIEKFFYRDVAGIRPSSPGYGTVTVFPKVPEKLAWAKASVESIRGPISVEWRTEKERFVLLLTLPAGVEATVHMPVLDFGSAVITEGGAAVWADNGHVSGVPGISAAEKTRDDYVSLSIGSGSYEFAASDRGSDEGTGRVR